MAAYRPLGVFPQYFLNDGGVNNGGFLHFYEVDLTTEKDTWSGPDMAIGHLNPNPVPLNTAGRPTVDIWGDGEYGVVLKTSSGSTIETRNNVQDGSDPGIAIPALVDGAFLTNNGVALIWQQIVDLLLPDMTGFADHLLSTDGQVAVWIPPADLNIPTITVTGNSVKIGDFLMQVGTDSVPAAPVFPHHSNSKAITFPIAYDTCYGCWAIGQNASIAANGYAGIFTSTSTTSGSTIAYNTNESNTDNSTWVTSSVPFSWFSIGLKA